MDDAGFERVARFPDARERLAECCLWHGRTEHLAVADAAGRLLATPVSAARPLPHHERVASDGYALQARDTFDAGGRSPASLAPTRGDVTPGTARRVDAGRPVPDGADAVVGLDHVVERGDQLLVHAAVSVGASLTAAGAAVSEGETVVGTGRRLRPSDLALCQAVGLDSVEVRERPQVSVAPTGDRLVDPGTGPGVGEAVETDRLVVSTLVERWGGVATERPTVAADADALRARFDRDTDHDLVVTTGGSSVGDRNLLPAVVAELGELLVHGVAIEPGHSVGIGRVGETPVVLLPGDPVACLVAAVQFLRPAVGWLAGAEPPRVPSSEARLTGKLASAPGERTYARVRLVDAEGTRDTDADGSGDRDADENREGDLPAAEPVSVGGTAPAATTRVDGWVEIPERREGIPAGEVVTVQEWERCRV